MGVFTKQKSECILEQVWTKFFVTEKCTYFSVEFHSLLQKLGSIHLAYINDSCIESQRRAIDKLLLHHLSISRDKLVVNRYGKPAMVPDPCKKSTVSISLSHTPGLVVLGTSENGTAIGVDVEYIKKSIRPELFALYAFDLFEYQALLEYGMRFGYPEQKMIIIGWSLKEAVAKAVGVPCDAHQIRLLFGENGLIEAMLNTVSIDLEYRSHSGTIPVIFTVVEDEYVVSIAMQS